MSALTHKSYAEFIKRKDPNVNLVDYNLLEFVGDTIFNYFVIDFFYKNSRGYREQYPPDAMHKL
jgi:dsRNA-specific ribonuclease